MPSDLHSQATVRAFDTTTGQCAIYRHCPLVVRVMMQPYLAIPFTVVGGWIMTVTGKRSGTSQAVARSVQGRTQVDRAASTWIERRALAVVAHAGKIFAIGGMDHAGPTRKVSIFDPVTKTWSDVLRWLVRKIWMALVPPAGASTVD
ncbi:MAG: kelch repeat-containing protein [Pirellulaceae bacterium]